MATPVFDGAAESEIKEMLSMAELDDSGQVTFMTEGPESRLIGR